MSISPYSLSILLLHLLIPVHPSIQISLSPTDNQALFNIRSNLKDLPGSNFFSTWNFNTSLDPCAEFSGIICSLDPSNSTLRVSVLTLGTGLENSAGLIGSLSNSIANLTSLTQLVIYPGQIYGPIPVEIGLNCRLLQLISISNNLMSGQIPSSLANLNELHTLDLSHNNLTGPIPDSLFSSLPNLRELVLSSNNLSGILPASLSYTTLYHIDLRQNSFTGTLPPLPPSLRYISVTQNSFFGTVIATFSTNLQNLTYIDFSMNRFTSKIPTSIFRLPRLSTILLQRNNFDVPITMPEQDFSPSWQVVDLSYNMISGQVPKELAQAQSLFLNSNKFSGPVPQELALRVYDGKMSTFYAQHNFLTAFPSPLVPLPESVVLCLSYNCMVLPELTESGCPASAGTKEPRPKEQCPRFDSKYRDLKDKYEN